MNRDISDLREFYQKDNLTLDKLSENPIEQFKIWFSEAQSESIKEPNAMIISTVNQDGFPSSRTVLLKEIMHNGFVFYTNYKSQKAQDIDSNPNVSIVFLWKEIERQVRISGKVEKVSREQSEAYFQRRPKGSQIGAWVSNQSQIIESREVLEERKKTLEAQYKNQDVLPVPNFWGGYLVKPNSMEFWQGRRNRLHDRLRYSIKDTKWIIERLSP